MSGGKQEQDQSHWKLKGGMSSGLAKKDKSKFVPTQHGTQMQGEGGQYKGEHFTNDKYERETSVEAAAGECQESPWGPFNVEKCYTASQDGFNASIEANMSLLPKSDIKVGDISIETGASAHLTVNKSGVSAGSEAHLARVTFASKPISTCIKSNLISLVLHGTVGFGAGFEGGVGYLKNKTNANKRFVMGTKVGRGLMYGGDFEVEISPNDPTCIAEQQALEQLVPTPTPNASVNADDTVSQNSHVNRGPSSIGNISDNQIADMLQDLGLDSSDVAQVMAKNSQDIKEIKQQVESINNYVKNEKVKENLQQYYQAGMQLCDGLSRLGRDFRCPQLAQAASLMGSGLNIGIGIAMCASSNVLMGAPMIFNGLTSALGSLFGGNGPDPNQIILENIRHLSKQLSAMHEDMCELFKQNFQAQEMLYNTMQKGFSALNSLMIDQLGSFRKSMQASFERIEGLQRDLFKLTHTGYQNLYLKDFTTLDAKVQQYISQKNHSNNSDVAVNLVNEVTAWAIYHSANTLINGGAWANVSELRSDDKLLSQLFAVDPSQTAYSAIGYFKQDLANPILWFKAVSAYCQLTADAWAIDFDNKQRDEVLKKGHQIIDFCANLRKDVSAWSGVIDEYNHTVKAIKNIMSQFYKHRKEIHLKDKGKVNKKFIDLISDELYYCRSTSGQASQALLEEFKTACFNLAYCNRVLAHFAYYAGKDIESIKTRKLATGKKIKKLLKSPKFKNKDEPNWLTYIKNRSSDYGQLGSSDIQLLAPLVDDSAHPIKLVEKGLLLLNLNQAQIHSLRLKFPSERYHQSIIEYETEAFRAYVAAALKSIYSIAKENLKADYHKAKDGTEGAAIKLISNAEYKKYFRFFRNWCVKRSKDIHFVGDKSLAKKIFDDKSFVYFNDNGWESNIAILFELATLYDKSFELDLSHAVNYIMWREGVIGMINMIVHPVLGKAAGGLIGKNDGIVSAENFQVLCDRQRDFIAEAYLEGENLYKAMEKITQSKVVEFILSKYIKKIIRIQDIERAKIKSGAKIQSILDKMDLYRNLLMLYAEMILPQFNWRKSFESFKGKKSLSKIIKGKNKDYTINSYLDDVNQAKLSMLNQLGTLRELMVFRRAAYQLFNKVNNNIMYIDGSTLIIDAKTLLFSFNDIKANMLSALLAKIFGINSLKIINDNFSDESKLLPILKLVRNHPELHTLSLVSSKITAKALFLCREIFSELNHIHFLDLSSNPLIDKASGTYEAISVKQLRDTLRVLPGLQQLKIDNTGLTPQAMRALACLQVNASAELKCVKQLSLVATQPIKYADEAPDLSHMVGVGPSTLTNELETLGLLQQHLQCCAEKKPFKSDKQLATKLRFFNLPTFSVEPCRQDVHLKSSPK